jgi:hypothetical protein
MIDTTTPSDMILSSKEDESKTSSTKKLAQKKEMIFESIQEELVTFVSLKKLKLTSELANDERKMAIEERKLELEDRRLRLLEAEEERKRNRENTSQQYLATTHNLFSSSSNY